VELAPADFDLYASELVLTEVGVGDTQFANRRLKLLAGVPLLPLNDKILELAEDLIGEGPIPRKAARDAAHVAIATFSEASPQTDEACRAVSCQLSAAERNRKGSICQP
jgi:hypothetical protein